MGVYSSHHKCVVKGCKRRTTSCTPTGCTGPLYMDCCAKHSGNKLYKWKRDLNRDGTLHDWVAAKKGKGATVKPMPQSPDDKWGYLGKQVLSLDTPEGALSESVYLSMQIRAAGGKGVKVQSRFNGEQFECERGGFSAKFVEYLKKCPAMFESVASTGALYAYCQVRPMTGNRVKIQVPGPKANRKWGASVEVDWAELRGWVKMKLKKPTPKPKPAAKPAFNVGDRVMVKRRYDDVLLKGLTGKVVNGPPNSAVSWKGFTEGHDCHGEFPLPYGRKSGCWISYYFLKPAPKKTLDSKFKVGDKVKYVGQWTPQLKGATGTVVAVQGAQVKEVYVNFPGHKSVNAKGWGCLEGSLIKRGGDEVPF